ncbi:hypothetical protein MtrunA17_Chr4g0041161 [Medicago truncatula]|uniref:Uncharacterized protein n=1 Tax=Medicago truncatula TaxID=3880 RepID=A0A396IG88_MEDTR|nr:hypothetical protein MtrunA17_Chr4g0041161 [Medicago truncatula]
MLPCPKCKIYLFFPIGGIFITGCYEKLLSSPEPEARLVRLIF